MNWSNLHLSSILTGNSKDKTKFSHKLLSTDTQVSKIRKPFANGLSANKIFSKASMSKLIQSGIIIDDIIAAISQIMLVAGKEALKKVYHWHQN